MNHECNQPGVTEATSRQQGAALLVILAIILLGGISLALDAVMIKSKRMHSDQYSKMALAQAKKALIAYAAMRAAKTPPPVKMYGKLPCPYNGPFRNTVAPLADYGEGAVEDPTCSVSLGFLPWQTLGLPPLLDGDLAPVWYALAPRFATGYATKDGFLCNQADLTINGDTSRYAAILLAPGQVLSLTAGIQNRSVNVIAQNLVQGYLEEDNADGDSTYEIRKIIQENSGDPNNPPFNDRLLGITCTEILNAMARL